MLIVWPAFLARHRPVWTIAKPACMNITRNPAINTQTMLIENRLWAMRSYRSPELRDAGTSPLPSAAGDAVEPAARPVGSGQVGLLSFSLVPEKYGGRTG